MKTSAVFVLFLVLATAGAGADERALVIDYEMNPPDFSNEVIRRVAATGMHVDFRQYYPVLTRADLARYHMLVLLSSAGGIGSSLQLPEVEIPAVVSYVARGGLLILGVPGDPEAFNQLRPYNRLLAALGSGIQVKPAIADDDSGRYLSAMYPQCYFRPASGTFAAQGVDQNLVLDRSTILEARPPALVLARTSPTAFAIVGLGRPRVPDMPGSGAFPVVAMAQYGKGYVLVTERFNLNIGGFNGRVGVQPTNVLDWAPSSDRFIQNILSEMASLARGKARWSGPAHIDAAFDEQAEHSLPAAPPAESGLISVPPGGAIERVPENRESYRAQYRATIRRDLYGQYLDHGLRAAWGDTNRDDDWLKRLAAGFKKAGLNYIWGVGWPDRFVSSKYSAEQRAALRHAWETFAKELDGSSVGWTIGYNYPGGAFDRDRYERCRGVDGRVLEILSPLDLRLWNEIVIPSLEEVARFSRAHPSVKGATIDFEMYGWEPIIFYPEAIGFEDAAFQAFLRSARGHLDGQVLEEAARLSYEQRYPWLRDRSLLETYYLLLEQESEKLGRLIRQRVRAINPNFLFGAYHAGLPYSWFYRGLIRGLSTPDMPMIWMSFQALSAADVDRFWLRGQHMLNASALMLGLYPIPQWKDAMMAGRRFHDGYWLNRYDWLVDDAKGNKSIEIPQGTQEEAWRALEQGSRLIDEYDRAQAKKESR
ncbi:MAG: hypothetical protein HY236_08950 [Acidobacteria bacterium]|nr:hypothetical protein [Acidobacteriota bacterium]